MLLPWHGMTDEDKVKVYKDAACHELHLFLHKRDPDFFNRVALPLISGKLEKSFIDWYLLCSTSNKHKRLLINTLENPHLIEKLNFLELCLLVEVCLKHGNESQKVTAKALATNEIMSFSV